MKIETRQVTIEKEIYIANDGREFDEETNCKEYEAGLIEAAIEFYDRDLERSDLGSCTYVIVKTPDEIEALIDLCRYHDISHKGISEKTGIYMYVDRRDMWTNISDTVDRLRLGGSV